MNSIGLVALLEEPSHAVQHFLVHGLAAHERRALLVQVEVRRALVQARHRVEGFAVVGQHVLKEREGGDVTAAAKARNGKE